MMLEPEDERELEAEAAELELLFSRGRAIAQPYGEKKWGRALVCPSPTRVTVSGFSPHSSAVASLPAGEQTIVRKAADLIIRSFRPRCQPIIAVRLVGHTDHDPFRERREPGFMVGISRARALAVKQALERRINNRAISSRIAWNVRGAGASRLVARNPTTEAGRRHNHRVDIWLSGKIAVPEFEAPETQMEDADERRRKALAKRLQNTPVGRALAKMGAKISIEKAPSGSTLQRGTRMGSASDAAPPGGSLRQVDSVRTTRRVFKVPERARPAAQATCAVFLSADSSSDYENYIAASTTGRMTPFVNGRYWGGAKPRADQFDAFNTMQEAVEGLQSGHWLFLAAWMFDPSLPLTKTNASGGDALGERNWGDLFQRKARDGVKIRILMTDFHPVFRDQHEKLYNTFLPALDKLIEGLPPASRDNLKYVVSLHPATHLSVHVATHHQKFMVLKTGEATTAFCGGLDIAFMRTPAYWGKLDDITYRWLWHDIHSRLEGLITNDLEREFVMRWNREKDHSVVASRLGWQPMEALVQSSPTETDRSAARNAQQLQMLRTVSSQGAGRSIQNTRRDDIWQGYLRLIGCANRFLYMENQYFREPRMADAIVKQAKAQAELVVIIVVPSETDDRPDPGKKHGDWLQHEFFVRLTKGVPASRLRIFTMFHRIIHSKFIMTDDRALCVGSANANPRGFFLDSELNVMLDDAKAVQAFRHRLWAHNLGVAETVVAGWNASAFIAHWAAVAAANEKFRSNPRKMTGEAIIPFDALKEKGERQQIIHDVETESLDHRS